MKIKDVINGFTDPKVFFVCFHFLNEGEKFGRTSSQVKSCLRRYSGPSISTDSASMGSVNLGLKMFLKMLLYC